jgi:hypothetical protein
MSRRKGTVEVRRRKAALFKGNWERTKAPGVEIVLSASKRGNCMYRVMVRPLSTKYGVSGPNPLFCRTLGEADETIAKLERDAHVTAAAIALGVV